jgi:hypothetical protein
MIETSSPERRKLLPAKAQVRTVYVFIFLLGSLTLSAQTPAPNPNKKSGEVFKNLQVLNDTPSDLLLPSMQFITSSLGVHCEYCHVEKAFEKDDKKPKQTAREMMRMMRAINAERFQGNQNVTCYTCHRASPKPLTVPLIPAVTPQLLTESELSAPAAQKNLPQPQDVLAKYVTALGGEKAIANLVSMEERGTFQADSQQFPIEMLRRKSDQMAIITHFAGSDRITGFDGTSGWLIIPDRPARGMSSAEADAARMDADLQFALDINGIFPDLKVKTTAKVGAENVVELVGQKSGVPAVEMYFSSQSGLLVRMVRYAPSAIGLNPSQTDYSDYRTIGGVKVPFQWISATPTGRFTIRIATARANAPVPDGVFTKPPGL